jgi:hypothetical protein
MRREFSAGAGRRYRSKATLFGLPVFDVAFGPHGHERRGKARGIVALGDTATGWLAIGGIARGIVAFGGITLGVFSFGGLAFGLLAAFAGLSASLGLANGGLAVGTLASGGMAIGYFAQGGAAFGDYARGGFHRGHAFPKHMAWLNLLLGRMPGPPFDVLRPSFFALVPLVLVAALIALIAFARHAQIDDSADSNPPPKK